MKVAGNFDDPLSDLRQDRGRTLPRLLISFAVMAALSLIVYFFDIPNPNIILLTGLTFFTTVYGFGAGIVASAVMVAYSLFFFSEGHDWVTFSPVNLQKMAVVVLGAAADTLLVGNLKRRHDWSVDQLKEMNRYLRKDNHTLEEASLTDALTGARNRFGLRRDYSQFEGRYLHVMMLDLDNFKRANDTFGHAVGDYILKKAGQQLTELFGANCCYRYGGDEFLVICIDMDKNVFPDKLNALRSRLNGIYLDDKPMPAHFSAGYVYGDCEFSYDLRLMMHQADSNLYDAKRQGRDRYVGTPFMREEAERIEQASHNKEHRAMNVNDLFAM